jgi:ubiquinone/menaquinone biosynthesis C-methylase UbiE
MKKDYGNDKLSAVNAKFEAQKLAFAPMAFMAAKVLRDTGILNAIATNPDKGLKSQEIANQLHLSQYSAEVLLDAGLSAQLLYMRNEHYILTKTGHFILNDKLTRTNMDFVADVCYKGMFHLQEAIETNTPAGLKELGNWPTIYHGLPELSEQAKKSWFAFDHYYSDGVFESILPIVLPEKSMHLLDVGGNTGKFAMQCAAYDPTATITIMDLPQQLNVARENAKKAGYENQIKEHPTDILDHNKPFPKGHDAIWMSQFLDCFAFEDIVQILTRAADSMKPSSRLYILETFWDRQKYEAATYSLNFTSLYFTALANGKSRMYHSEEMKEAIEKAGLKAIEEKDDLGVSHTLLTCSK